jgi:hypothetical protein
MRVYRKQALEQRRCVYCAKPFESAHKRRNSCSTLAYYARRAQSAPADGRTLAVALPDSAEVPALAAPAPVVASAPLPLDLQPVGVVAAGTMGAR